MIHFVCALHAFSSYFVMLENVDVKFFLLEIVDCSLTFYPNMGAIYICIKHLQRVEYNISMHLTPQYIIQL